MFCLSSLMQLSSNWNKYLRNFQKFDNFGIKVNGMSRQMHLSRKTDRRINWSEFIVLTFLLPCFLTWVIDKFKIRQMYHILVTNKTRSYCIIGSNTVNGQQDVLPKWISLRKNTRWWMIRKCTRESRLISKFSHKF